MSGLKQVTIFADGACIPNPGPGGWAIRLQFADTAAEMVGSEKESTNLRMEVRAVLEALRCLKEPCEVLLVDDSDYVCDGMEKWLPGWKKRHWKASDGDPIKHTDLWMPIDALLAVHRVTVERPTTPTAIQLNARMDQLANQAAVKQLKNALTPLGT